MSKYILSEKGYYNVCVKIKTITSFGNKKLNV